MKTVITRTELEKHYFPKLTLEKAKKLILCGSEYYTSDGWEALLEKSEHLGIGKDELKKLINLALSENKIREKRRLIWQPFSIIILIALVFCGVWVGVTFGTLPMALFMIFWIVVFGWFIFSDRF